MRCLVGWAQPAKMNKSARRSVFATMPKMPNQTAPHRNRSPLTSQLQEGLVAALLGALVLLPGCDKSSTASEPAAAQAQAPSAQAPAAGPQDSLQALSAQAAPEPISAPAPAATGTRANGESCSSGNECQSGICEGMGCDERSLGTCMTKERPCTYDWVPFCGCDGETFNGSGVCPGKRYKHAGACEGGEQGAAQEEPAN